MRKLYRAECHRLLHSRLFFILCLAVLLISAVEGYSCAGSALASLQEGEAVVTEDFFYNLAPYCGVYYAAFIALFLGDEFANGTVRNKLIGGYGRGELYLGYFAVCLTACAALSGCWLLGSLAGRFRFGPFAYGLRANLAYLLAILACAAVWCAIFCMLSTGGRNRAVVVVLAFAAWFALILAGSALVDRLNCAEEVGGLAYIDGQFTYLEPRPNPLYVGGTARVVLSTLAYMLPGSVAIYMNDWSLEKPLAAAALSFALALLLLLIGMWRFRRKDLK